MDEEKVSSGTVVVVKKGSITGEDVDALVNAANSYMYMGGGVAGAIKRAGGDIIEEEALRKAPVPIGEAVATTAGKLNARFIIHAPTMVRPGLTNPDNVYKATKAALEKADEVGIHSIAIPGMGTGVGRVPPESAAEAVTRAVKNHIKRETGIRKIVLIDIDDEMVRCYESARADLVRDLV